jgi:hypothetical protein
LIIKKTLTHTLFLKKGEGSLFYKFPLLSEERNKACPEYIRGVYPEERRVQYKLHRRGEEFIKEYQNK